MRYATLAFIKAVVDGIQQVWKPGGVLAVLVLRHGGYGISSIGHGSHGAYPL
jgi:hypothetical protein